MSDRHPPRVPPRFVSGSSQEDKALGVCGQFGALRDRICELAKFIAQSAIRMAFEEAHQDAFAVIRSPIQKMFVKKLGDFLRSLFHARRLSSQMPERAAASHHVSQREARQIVCALIGRRFDAER